VPRGIAVGGGKLGDARADDLATEYDPMQVSAHRDAVSLFGRDSRSGDGAKLKDWAGKTLPARQHHVGMAQAMDKNSK
jgi:putative membrane protein